MTETTYVARRSRTRWRGSNGRELSALCAASRGPASIGQPDNKPIPSDKKRIFIPVLSATTAKDRQNPKRGSRANDHTGLLYRARRPNLEETFMSCLPSLLLAAAAAIAIPTIARASAGSPRKVRLAVNAAGRGRRWSLVGLATRSELANHVACAPTVATGDGERP